MKKVLLILTLFIAVSCSKSEDSSDNTNTDTKINLPDWLNGTYKADHFGTTSPGVITLFYPKSNPYSIEFKSKNDMMTKALSATNPIESLQSKINDLVSSGKLVSVEESYNTIPDFTSYIIVITTKPIPPSTSNEHISFTITKSPAMDANKIKIDYKNDGWGGSSYYTLQ